MATLITGGTGLLGPNVAQQYLGKSRDKVVLFDKFEKRIDFLETFADRVQYVTGDLIDFDSLLQTCNKHNIEYVVHLGAIADVDIAEENPLQACDVNVKGTYNVLEVCRRLHIKRVVYASTGAIYGKAKGPVRETAPYDPPGIYEATKVMGETICREYHKSYGIDVVIVRLYFLYGPRMFFEPISPFGMVKNAVAGKPTNFPNGSDQLFEFTHVRDAAQGIVLSLLAASSELGDRVFNISSGRAIPLRDFASLVRKYIPNAVITLGPGELGLKRGFPLDISLAKKVLGYSPAVDIEKGIEETIKWLQENHE